MDDLTKELGKPLSEGEHNLRSRLKSPKELIYEHLLRLFEAEAVAFGGWASEDGVNLDGKLWHLSEHIAEGDFDLIGE